KKFVLAEDFIKTTRKVPQKYIKNAQKVNTPPPKGGGFVLRLKSAIPAKAGLAPADAGLR
ncbi:MAG: hypothetical protein ACE5IR_29075, partial [bacterium]